MHREKRETPPVFCPIQLARISTRAGRIEWPANRAFAVRSVNRTFVRTTGRPRDEIGRTAWEPKSGTSSLDVPTGKKRDAKQVDGFSEDVHHWKPIIFFPCSGPKIS